ncbi:hypothetical protein [Clostridium lacusfryxellense]|uniref:hypothetical protein n=1 Tax=Clostridium lacusfryxellense TaxID=205328 RepID=UPI001C0DBF47|nr:hypothetical protein [Clostridium lacusfryxellense]MBU3110271.1 hypothetical protein [Clostridium lacusfryxellense]
MRSYKLAKYNIKSSIKSIIIFYSILISVLIGMELLSVSNGNGYTSGLELASTIFLFVFGLNFFRENFYFSQANNIPRADYFKSVVIAILPIALVMSVLDVIINRVYNLFSVSPTMYDMAYNLSFNLTLWVQSNSIKTLFGTITFLFSFYIAAFGVGLLITMIYYKCNKTMKIIVSLSPIAIITIYGRIAFVNPGFKKMVETFVDNIFGISTKNSYMCVLTFICFFVITMSFVYLMVRKAVVKRD